MTEQEILVRLEDIARRALRQNDLRLTLETTAADVDGWDSLAHARLILQVEAGFGVVLPGARLFDLDSVGALVTLLQDLLGREPAAGAAG